MSNGEYKLVNGSRAYLSGVEYSCREGYVVVGRSYLSCDVDERWNGPPPRCEPIRKLPALQSPQLPLFASFGGAIVTSVIAAAVEMRASDCLHVSRRITHRPCLARADLSSARPAD